MVLAPLSNVWAGPPPAVLDVHITFVHPDASDADLRALVSELLEHRGLQVIWRHQPALRPQSLLQPDAVANRLMHVWIALDAPQRPQLIVRAGRTDRALLRDLVLPRGLDAAAREAIAQMIDSAAAVLLDGTIPFGVPTQEVTSQLLPAPQDPQPETQTPPPKHQIEPELSIYHVTRMFMPQAAFTQGPGLAGRIEGGRFGIWTAIEYQMPRQFTGPDAAARFATWALRLGGDVSWGGARTRWRLGMGLGPDVVTVTPSVPPGRAGEPTSRRTLAFATGRLFGALDVRVSPRFAVFAALSVDAYAARVRYQVLEGELARNVVQPFAARPGIALGGTFD